MNIDMCQHAYVTRVKIYYDKKLECRVRKETDTCLFCGRLANERITYMNDPPRRKLPYFGPHLK